MTQWVVSSLRSPSNPVLPATHYISRGILEMQWRARALNRTSQLPHFCAEFETVIELILFNILLISSVLTLKSVTHSLIDLMESIMIYVQVVAPFVIDFQTMRPAFVATPDYCEIAITCQYEDNLNYGAASSIPWMTIKGGASTKLVYLSEDPWSFSERELDILLSVSPWPSPGCRPLGRWWPGIRRMSISG